MKGLKLQGLNFIKYFYTVTVTIKVQSIRRRVLKKTSRLFLKPTFNKNNCIYEG